ncbi:hypothetical protein ZWY2020_011465 [Hordeum vulgare]|nr:hypothetical protein ZWY2020_011465 [Hordeum vulgare]
MLAMEQQHHEQEESCVPPGFRFHPTEEELVGYYLARKVAAQKIDLDIIQEVDLYRIEPWDLQERCGGGRGGRGARQVPEDDQTSSEWYFFSFKDRKYPSGTRTNRATAAGFWKATGRDKPVTSSRSRGVIGMRKTLVFYTGRAPNGRKTDWIIHEYRLQTNEHAPTQEEGWVSASGATGAGGLGFPGQGIQYSDDVLESKHSLLGSIPQLIESPPTISTTVAGYGDAGYDIIQQGEAAAGIDWNFLDSLLSTSQLHQYSATAASHLQLQQ